MKIDKEASRRLGVTVMRSPAPAEKSEKTEKKQKKPVISEEKEEEVSFRDED